MYQPIAWARLVQADAGMAGAAVVVRAGLGADQTVELLADAGSATHVGIAVYEPGTDDLARHVLARRHTLAHRQVEEAIRYQRGLDVESTYLLRGTYRPDLVPGARQGATIVVDSIAPALELDAPPASRPGGRNWFVRAGASGGDGSVEAPFRDPFQALEKAEGGDTIHVAEGAYVGRLRCGVWRIPIRNLTLLGGYRDDFTTRDPWRHPVRFVLTPEEMAKGIPGGPILAAEDACDGLVLDGFVFDGATYNAYTDDGALDVSRSLSSALLELSGGGGAVTVRNCTFLNAANSAVQITSASGVFENNLVVNTSGTAVRLRTPGAGPWVVRGNTILFAADPTNRASTGQSTVGGLLEVDGRAVVRVESNLLAFADGIAVRSGLAGQNLVLDGNVLAANLHADVSDGRQVMIDRAGWDRAAVLDTPFGSLAANRFDLPALPVDRAFAQRVVDRLASLPASLAPDLLVAAAGALGVSPRSAPTAPTPSPTPPAATASVSDLLADLGRMREEFETKDRGEAEEASVVYCPACAWDAVLALARDAPGGQPGARAVAIAVSFAEAPAHQPVEYRLVDGAGIDAGAAALDGAAIEVEVTDVRSGSTNPSLYPAGTTRDDHEAFTVAAAGDPTRTRLVVVVRNDTAVSKVFARLVPTDAVRVRGVGRLMFDGKALAVVADSAERR